ncbi:hypothetical protein Droror1_Dr00018731 [Drosera rotundifolia]
MALAIGKLSILVGAGLLGSVLATKEGGLPGFSDLVKGAFKIALKPLKQSDSAPLGVKRKNDALVAQVNSLRHELQLLASSRPVTIVTSTTKGGRRYGVIILVVVVGYGYVWWKGWKLPDLPFATKRSLSEATTSIAKQLDQVYSSVSTTRRNLSSKIDMVDSGLTEMEERTDKINNEVVQLRGGSNSLGFDIETFDEAIQTLETKLDGLNGNEDKVIQKLQGLLDAVENLDAGRPGEQLKVSSSRASSPALEHAQTMPPRIITIRPTLSLEPPSPSSSSSDGSNEVRRPLRPAISSAGLKDLYGMDDSPAVPVTPRVTNGNIASGESYRSSGLGSFGWRVAS